MTHGPYNEFEITSSSEISTPELSFSIPKGEEIRPLNLIIPIIGPVIILIVKILLRSSILNIHTEPLLLSFDMIKQPIKILISLSITLQTKIIAQ